MNKYFLSAVVIITFLGYSLYQRVFGVEPMAIITPKSVSQAFPASTPTNTPTPTQEPKSTVLPQPTYKPIPTATPVASSGYQDGTYTGNAADAFYGMIQVQATIANGKIINIRFLQYPNDRGTSIVINQQADPMLAQEAIQAQSANVDIISGATDSSQAFIQSLQSALDKAKN